MEPNFKIYALYEENKPGEIRYIGRTKLSIEKRLYFHIKGISHDNGYKSNWIKSVIKKGGQIKTYLLLENLTENESKQKEIEFISQYENDNYKLTNGTNGGDGLSMPTKEVIEKIRNSKLGKPSKKKGVPLSFYFGEEQAAIMNVQNSQRQLGKKLTIEHKEKIQKNSAKIWLGKHLSKEHSEALQNGCKLAKLKNPSINKKRIENSRKSIIQTDKNNNFIREWNSIQDAADSIKINRSGIGEVCSGKRKSAGGFVWKFKNINK